MSTTTDDAIVVFDPHGTPMRQVGRPAPTLTFIAREPLNSVSEFGTTADTVMWRTPGGLQTAPFAEPR